MLVLASNSPRRRQLLALTGWTFDVRPVEIDESPWPGEAPPDYVLRLAQSKARAAAQLISPGQIILSADTTVADGMQILGKPENPSEAREMLLALRGRDHMVYTALAGYRAGTEQMQADLCGTRVWMRSYSDAEIAAYIASGDPFDKAGGYAIQNVPFHPVEKIEGCYGCVMGLSVCRAVQLLRAFNLTPQTDVVCECQLDLNIACAVYQHFTRQTLPSTLNQNLNEEPPDGSQIQGNRK